MDGPATVAACQLAVADCDVDANLAAVEKRVGALADAVDVALFPEHALTGFVADERVREAAISRDGPAVSRLRAAAAEADCALFVGFVEDARETDGPGDLYNAAAYVRPGGDVTVYRKRHLWGGEADVLTPGEERVVVDTPAGRTGLMTCYDLNFVHESSAMTDERVDALFVVGAWPAAHAENWRLLCRARALDGVRYCVAAGRTGRRDLPDARPAKYAGCSLAAKPDGSVLESLDREPVDLVVTLDPAVLAEQRDLVGALEDDPSSDEQDSKK